MQCPSCDFDNREGRRFCSECGAALSQACSACGFVNEPGDKFCGGCGAQLGEGAPTPTPARASPSEASRRQLTVLFCDLAGSTALAERLDPEEMSDLLAAYQDACAEVIARFDGHIGRYVGDALLVYFGYPHAHEDDAARAVRAALGITQAIKRLNATLDRSDVELAVRIGIATGLVVVGDIGKGERKEKAAIVGETPNLAARLQALAHPNTTIIADTTEHLVRGLFVCENLGPQSLKGVSQPVPVYAVREESGVHSQFEAKVRAGLTPLVGREEEADILARRWQRTRDGTGQVVLISGEAGMGKSRILQGFQERFQRELRNRVLYYGSPYHRDTPLHPVVDQLERALRIEPGDSVERRLDKLETVLSRLELPAQEYAPVFAFLLSLPESERYPAMSLSPEDARTRVLEASVTVIERMAAMNPVLMVVEDLHWFDPTTVELLNLLIARIESMRVLLVGTTRPGFESTWKDNAQVRLIALNRLSPAEARILSRNIAGGKPLPEEMMSQIIARADGVPLFIEELTKTALESGVLEEHADRYALSGPLPPFAIPASLRDSLMARLDRLAPVNEIAQMAAALGRSFTREVLAAVSQVAESSLQESLDKLVDAELIYQRGLPPNVVYEFKHALVQDVAYSSLLKAKRQQLHRRVAELFETEQGETARLHPELLAHHYAEAAMPEQAIPYCMSAGDAAAARFARAEASAHYQAALDMARSLPESDSAARARVEAVLKLAGVAANRTQFEHALDNLEQAQQVALKIDDQSLLSRVLYWVGRAHYVLGRFDLGVEYAGRALEIADELGGDDALTAGPVNLLARIHCLRGEPRQATEYGARSVEQMARLGDRVEEAAVAGVLAFAYTVHGNFDRAREAAERGVELARTTSHLPTIAACLMFRAVVKGWHGELDAAVSDFEESIAASQEAGDVFRIYLNHGFRGQSYLVASSPAQADQELTRCLALGEELGTSFHRGAFQSFLAKVRLDRGEAEEALELAEKALSASADVGQEWSRSIALRAYGEVLLAIQPNAWQAAEDALAEALDIQQRRECRFDLAWTRAVCARLAEAKGDTDGARRARATAEELFREMGISPAAADLAPRTSMAG